jgi:hypothetical protein
VPHETNIDVRGRGHSAGVQRRRWCADELCEQAFFAGFSAGIHGADGLDNARELNACATATGRTQRAVVNDDKSATGNHSDGVSPGW